MTTTETQPAPVVYDQGERRYFDPEEDRPRGLVIALALLTLVVVAALVIICILALDDQDNTDAIIAVSALGGVALGTLAATVVR